MPLRVAIDRDSFLDPDCTLDSFRVTATMMIALWCSSMLIICLYFSGYPKFLERRPSSNSRVYAMF